MSSSPPTTYWCHECDMSILLSSPPSPPRCPHCQNSFLDHMDSFPPTGPPPSLAQPSPASRASSRSVIESLKGATIDDLAGLEFCSICKDQFGGGGEGVVANELPCGHVFHNVCIVPWLEICSTCPLCRFRLGGEGEGEGEGEEVEVHIGGMRLDELLDEEGVYEDEMRRLMRIEREGGYEDELSRLMRVEREGGWNGGRMMFSPTQIGEAGTGGGEVQRANSVETVSSWPVWQPEGEREVGTSEVENVVRA